MFVAFHPGQRDTTCRSGLFMARSHVIAFKAVLLELYTFIVTDMRSVISSRQIEIYESAHDKAVIFIRLVGKDHCADTSDYGAYIHNSWTRFRFLEQKEECVRSDCCTKDVDGENLLEDCAEATRSDLGVFNDPRIVLKIYKLFCLPNERI
jgi:hypothetical protein